MFTKQAYEIFVAAVDTAQPEDLLRKNVSIKHGVLHIAGQQNDIATLNRFLVFAIGKAAPAMAKAVEKQAGEIISEGYCVTKYKHAIPLTHFQIIEAAHPVPDENSVKAGEIILNRLQQLTEADIVLFLISGGASSLLADVPEGCTLEEIQKTSALLINSGATINEINTVRKHLSFLKGGQLAKAAYPAKIVSLIISDVTGDDISSIASGPTVPDSSTFKDAFQILKKYNIWVQTAESVKNHITRGLNNEIDETPKPGSLIFKNTVAKIIANNQLALEAAFQKAVKLGYHSLILNDTLTGNTEKKAREFIHYVLQYKGDLPACILMGGETTLNVSGIGKGGRNQHFVLSALHEWQQCNLSGTVRDITILSAGTDGTDGPTDAAGAAFNTKSIPAILLNDKITAASLAQFDSYNYFTKYGGLIVTGPTQTNVMDIVIALIH
ncbi:MAG: glycerate kinase [Chitinophagaceae bacterium]